MRAFLDIDGVLTDFVGDACRVHNRPNPYNDGYNLGVWDVDKLLGMSSEEFWKPLKGYTFWKRLPWMYDGKQLLHSIEQMFDKSDICLLTCPCDSGDCLAGKYDWIKENCPEYSKRFFMGPPKEFAAGPDTVLIDDRELNVNDFSDNGGWSILVPRPWNLAWELNTVKSVVSDIVEVRNAYNERNPSVVNTRMPISDGNWG